MEFYYRHQHIIKQMFPTFTQWVQFLIVGLGCDIEDMEFRKSMRGFEAVSHLRPGVWVNSVPENEDDILLGIYKYTQIMNKNPIFKKWLKKVNNKLELSRVDYDGFIPQGNTIKDLDDEYKEYKLLNVKVSTMDYSAKYELRELWSIFRDWSGFLIAGMGYRIVDTFPILELGQYGPIQDMNYFANYKWAETINPREFIICLSKWAHHVPEKKDHIRKIMEKFEYMTIYIDDDYMEQFENYTDTSQIHPKSLELMDMKEFESYYLKFASLVRNSDMSDLITEEEMKQYHPMSVEVFLRNASYKKN